MPSCACWSCPYWKFSFWHFFGIDCQQKVMIIIDVFFIWKALWFHMVQLLFDLHAVRIACHRLFQIPREDHSKTCWARWGRMEWLVKRSQFTLSAIDSFRERSNNSKSGNKSGNEYSFLSKYGRLLRVRRRTISSWVFLKHQGLGNCRERKTETHDWNIIMADGKVVTETVISENIVVRDIWWMEEKQCTINEAFVKKMSKTVCRQTVCLKNR